MNILIIRLSSLGDVVLAGYLVKQLRDTFPDARIDFLTGNSYLPLLDSMTALDGRYDNHRGLSIHYDIVIDLQNNLRSRFIVRQIGGGTRVLRFHRRRLNRFLRIHFPLLRSKLSVPSHVALQYLDVVRSLGVTESEGRIFLNPPQEWLEKASSLMREHNLPSKSLLIAPGGRHPTKIWLADHWFEFIKKAYSAGFRYIGIIGQQEDMMTALRFRESLHGEFPISIFCGKTDMTSLTGLIAHAGLLVCGDSGPMHIAAAVGTPVTAIFGPTVHEFGFAPFSENARIVEVPALPCRPCHPHGPDKCPLGHFRCMVEITPEMVLSKALEITKPNNSVQ